MALAPAFAEGGHGHCTLDGGWRDPLAPAGEPEPPAELMASREDIHRLIHRPFTGKQVLSLFLDMSVNSDNKRTHGVFLSKQKGRFSELDSDREGHHREALGAAFSRVEQWLEERFEEANKGIALYAEIGSDWMEGYQVAVPLQNRLEIAERPIIGPLAEVVESHPLYGVAIVDRTSLWLLTLRSGQVQSEQRLAAESHPAPHEVQASGSSHEEYQNRKEQERRNFFKEAVRELEEFDRRHRPEYLIVLGTEENVKLFTSDLGPSVQEKLVYTAAGPGEARAAEVVERLLPFFGRRKQEKETRALEQLHDRVRQRHFAAAGVQQTLEQLQEGKVDTLVLARDLRNAGGQCQQCGFFLSRHDGACPYCGGEIRDGVDIAEVMIRMAEEQEIPVEFVSQQALADMNGAGALLKFQPHSGLG